jgi:2-polyprenyl-3-methyl-5-hydroxy-6-metoxy-1,4-benzoquinol methylase
MQQPNAYQYNDLRERQADRYAATKYRILLSWLAGRERLSILNAGCGSGELSLLLASVGHSVVGIDPAPEYIDLARSNLAARPLADCSFSVSSIEDYRPAEKFDCVVATDVLEHIENDRYAFKKLVGHVKPGGDVLITVPAGQYLFGYHDEQLGHYRRYSRRSLAAVAKTTCQIRRLRYFGFVLMPVCWYFSKFRRIPYPVAESGDSSRSPLTAWLLSALLTLDRFVPMPAGTSVLMHATRMEAS